MSIFSERFSKNKNEIEPLRKTTWDDLSRPDEPKTLKQSEFTAKSVSPLSPDVKQMQEKAAALAKMRDELMKKSNSAGSGLDKINKKFGL